MRWVLLASAAAFVALPGGRTAPVSQLHSVANEPAIEPAVLSSTPHCAIAVYGFKRVWLGFELGSQVADDFP